MIEIYYNPLDINCKSVLGAVGVGVPFTITVSAPNLQRLSVCFHQDNGNNFAVEMTKNQNTFTCSLTFQEKGLYFYNFQSNGVIFGKGDNYLAQEGVEDCFQLSIYIADYTTPDWIKGGLIYQIFPDRFCRGDNTFCVKDRNIHENWNELPVWEPNELGEITNDDFFGGNIKGITEQLDYLKSLNVSAIYLNPINKAKSNHRYDVGDYMVIDQMLGSNEDFINLCNKAKNLGIRVILDGVYNHTGDDSRYFNRYGNYNEVGAYQSRNSVYHNWYNFYDYPNGYNSWWGFKTLPALNKENKVFRHFITGEGGVLTHYLDYGASGYRLDVVDELPDSFVKEIRKAVKSRSADNLLIGEVWEDATNKIAYGVRREYFLGEELDSIMNYPLRSGILHFLLKKDSSLFVQTINDMADHFPTQALHTLMNILGTHDTPRLLTVLAGLTANTREEMAVLQIPEYLIGVAIERFKKAILMQFTVYGVPSIYYGDELGMQGYKDPFNRQTFNKDNKIVEINDFIKKVSDIRYNYNHLFKSGLLKFEYVDSDIVVYSRTVEDESIYIGINCSNSEYQINFNGSLKELLTETTYQDEYILKPNDICVLI